jgi:hypothetical protein
MSYSDRDAAILDALHAQAVELLAQLRADAACSRAGAWASEEFEGIAWERCGVCGWARGAGHGEGCGFRADSPWRVRLATRALWAYAHAVARAMAWQDAWNRRRGT